MIECKEQQERSIPAQRHQPSHIRHSIGVEYLEQLIRNNENIKVRNRIFQVRPILLMPICEKHDDKSEPGDCVQRYTKLNLRTHHAISKRHKHTEDEHEIDAHL